MSKTKLSFRCVSIFIVATLAFTPMQKLLGQETASLKSGFSDRDITPEIGMEAPGGYGKAFHQTLHDACKVRASVFDDGTNVVAIVGIDAIGIHRQSVVRVRQAIREATGIPDNAILIGASHSHSSGPVTGVFPGEFDHASELVKHLAYDETINVNTKYLEHVERQLVDAVTSAYQNRIPVLAGIGKGIEDQVAFNRRFKMRDGREVSHPGLGNPEIIEPAGPVDPEVGVIGVWAAAKPQQILGCVVNFACHATTNPGGISANYIHYLEKVIQGYYGKECVVVFVNGASGDVTQVNNQSPYQYPAAERWAEQVGGRVGAEALKVLFTMEPGNMTPVAAVTKTWSIKRRVPSPAKVEHALALMEKDRSTVDATEWTFAKETLMLDAKLQKQPEVDVEVQAIQVGSAVFVTTEAEYFCQYGLDIKSASGFPFTFPVSLANGCIGYVPTERALSPGGGGYETRLTSYSNLEKTAGSQLRDAGIELCKQLTPGPTPTPPLRQPFTGTIWTYGNAGPEIE